MLCHFAHTFPDFVADFLDQGLVLNRQFREETVTDMMMASLASIGSRGVKIRYPHEPTTGADMEWNFVNRDDQTFFRLLIQAKKLNHNGGEWRRFNYPHLGYKTKSASKPQAVVLAEAAKSEPSTFPLYAFYNFRQACDLAQSDGNDSIRGVNLMHGHLVAAKVEEFYGTKKWLWKSLGQLEPNFMGLEHIFCPESLVSLGPMAFAGTLGPLFLYASGSRRGLLGYSVGPRPFEIRDRIQQYHDAILAQFEVKERAALSDHLGTVPEVGTSVPKGIVSLLEGKPIEPDAPNRIRVIFESRNESERDEEV